MIGTIKKYQIQTRTEWKEGEASGEPTGWFKVGISFCKQAGMEYHSQKRIHLSESPPVFVEGLQDGKSRVYDEQNPGKASKATGETMELMSRMPQERHVRQNLPVSVQSQNYYT